MISCSGGLGSTVLLDLVKRCYFPTPADKSGGDDSGKPRGGTKHPRNQSVWKEARVCYVETCGAFPGSEVLTFFFSEIRSIVNEIGIDARQDI